MGAKPVRENLIEWVLSGWDKLPLDLLQRGMEALILEPALAPLPPPLSPLPPKTVRAVVPADVAAVSSALTALDSLGGKEDKPVNLPDELDPPSEPEPEPEGEPGPPPTVCPPDAVCLRCERPVRVKNSLACVKCHAWHHVGCLAGTDPAICPLCQ